MSGDRESDKYHKVNVVKNAGGNGNNNNNNSNNNGQKKKFESPKLKAEDVKSGRTTNVWPFAFKDIFDNLLNLPDNLEQVAQYYFSGDGKQKLDEIAELLKSLKFSRIILVGNTFNYFSSLVFTYYLTNLCKRVKFCWENYELSEFYDYILPRGFDDMTLYLFISKSGRSRLMEKAVEQMRLFKINPELIWLITNHPEVKMAKSCGVVLPIKSQPEIILGTNSFPNTMFVLHLLAQILTDDYPISSKFIENFHDLIENMKGLDLLNKSGEIVEFLGTDFEFLYCLSRGPSMAAAYSAALGAQSFGRFFAEATTIGLFFHGPFQIANEAFRCVIFIGEKGDEKNSNVLHRLISQITTKTDGGRVILISNSELLTKMLKENPSVKSINFSCNIPELSPIVEMYIFTAVFLEIAKCVDLIQCND